MFGPDGAAVLRAGLGVPEWVALPQGYIVDVARHPRVHDVPGQQPFGRRPRLRTGTGRMQEAEMEREGLIQQLAASRARSEAFYQQAGRAAVWDDRLWVLGSGSLAPNPWESRVS